MNESKAAFVRETAEFGYDPDPANPGWFIWGPRVDGRFNTLFGPMRVLPLGGGRSTVRIVPQRLLTSANNTMHGGALMGFMDISLFAGATGCGCARMGWAVTLEMATQFLAPARHDVALDAEIELLSETGRLLFLRGLVRQEDELIASFSATVRKAPAAAGS
jgi:acyl-coenzyme A thioesterase PaaI-like protein